MKAVVLPDFLRLSAGEAAREKDRQEQARQEFNTRVRQSPAAYEYARAIIFEADLKKSIKAANSPEEKKHAQSRYAENLAQQGRFLEAAKRTKDKEAARFYKKAAEAVFNGTECSCAPPFQSTSKGHVRVPKYHVVKEIHSLKLGHEAFLVECAKCGNWVVLGSKP